MLLILVDAHSMWMDIYVMSSITTGNLKASFSTHGLPDVLVTDNGPSELLLNWRTKCLLDLPRPDLN